MRIWFLMTESLMLFCDDIFASFTRISHILSSIFRRFFNTPLRITGSHRHHTAQMTPARYITLTRFISFSHIFHFDLSNDIYFIKPSLYFRLFTFSLSWFSHLLSFCSRPAHIISKRKLLLNVMVEIWYIDIVPEHRHFFSFQSSY